MDKVLDTYTIKNENLEINVTIIDRNEFVPYYEIHIPGVAGGTKILLETKLKADLVSEVEVDISEILDPKMFESVKKKFLETAEKVILKNFPKLNKKSVSILSAYLVQNTIGLGNIDNLLSDSNLEEVVVNKASEPVWVYHKKYGWCKTNIKMKSDDLTYDYASMIARKVGRQINTLNPLLDAHLPDGSRVNATLSPVSSFGNTITIRKFSKNPWTITRLIREKSLSMELASLIWLCIQNELSLLVSGGTGSGKTSFLNALASLIPPNQRIISIEDTRELTLPSFLHWVPMVTREPNPEGKGEVTMLDLMVNALRQRPDRILVGEVRRKREAEILFEAMHTGHSVYATLHADNSEQTISRLTNPPMDIPKEVLDALVGIVVTFRHRRIGIRRVLEFSEVMKKGEVNILYRLDIKKDVLEGVGKVSRIKDMLSLYSGMTEKEISDDVSEKVSVLEWMMEKNLFSVDEVGTVMSRYYLNRDELLDAVSKGRDLEF